MAQINDQASVEGRRDERIRPPCFCKTVSEYSVQGGLSCWMQVPPEFVRNHLPHLDQIGTVLQNADGATWPLQLVAEHGFVTGWREFATGNALAIGDTLVFSFVEETKYFTVQVFDKSECEKGAERRELARPQFRPEHDSKLLPYPCSDGADLPLAIRNGGHIQPGQQAEICRSGPSISQADPRDDVKAMGRRGDPASRNSRPWNHGKIGLDAAADYHGERGGPSSLHSLRRENTEAVPDLSQPRVFPPQSMHPQANFTNAGAVVTVKRKRGRPSKQLAPGSLYPVYSTRDSFISRRRKVTEAEREQALHSANQLASELNEDSTTFVMVMRHSYVYQHFVLYVPRPFANLYMPDTNREVAMVDSAWNMWFGKWNASRKYISGGWRNFSLQHCLEEGDAVVMEVLEEYPAALTLKVHLFPVVPVPEGITGWHSHVCPASSSYSDPISTGVPIDPLPRIRGRITPRPQPPRKRPVARKRVHYGSEDSFTTSDSSYESD